MFIGMAQSKSKREYVSNKNINKLKLDTNEQWSDYALLWQKMMINGSNNIYKYIKIENLEFDEYYAIVHHVNQGDWYIKKNTLFVDVMKKYPVQLKIYEMRLHYVTLYNSNTCTP